MWSNKMETEKTIFMPKKLLKKWLKALRTPISKGGYRQASGTLHDPETGGFCCLGVLQHVATGGEVQVDEKGKFRCLPTKQWLLANDIKFVNHEGYAANYPELPLLGESAPNANDDGVSFRKLADAIEDCAVGT